MGKFIFEKKNCACTLQSVTTYFPKLFKWIIMLTRHVLSLHISFMYTASTFCFTLWGQEMYVYASKLSHDKIWLLCLVPTSTTRFASDVGYRMAKKWIGSVFALTQNLRVQHWKDGSGTRNFKCRCVLGTQKLSRQKYQINKPLSITISPLRSTDWQFIPGHFHFAVDHLSPCRLFRPMQPRLFLGPTCRRLGLCYVGLIE